MPTWAQIVAALLGLAVLLAGLLVGPVIIAAPGFLVLVLASSSLSCKISLSPATFGLVPAVAPRADDDTTAA